MAGYRLHAESFAADEGRAVTDELFDRREDAMAAALGLLAFSAGRWISVGVTGPRGKLWLSGTADCDQDGLVVTTWKPTGEVRVVGCRDESCYHGTVVRLYRVAGGAHRYVERLGFEQTGLRARHPRRSSPRPGAYGVPFMQSYIY